MEGIDYAVRHVCRMEKNPDCNLKRIALLIVRVQDDTCDGNLSLFAV
jgi:hypothetical protein